MPVVELVLVCNDTLLSCRQGQWAQWVWLFANVGFFLLNTE